MIIKNPVPSNISEMKKLWTEAFGDSSEAVDTFFDTAYSPDRCMILTENGETASVLYIFDCEYRGDKAAYLYAVATSEKYRGRGFCRRLMEATHEYLKKLGYAFALLHPGEEALFQFYRRIGYKTCGWVSELSVEASSDMIELKNIDKDSYVCLRRKYLSENGILQKRESFDYLATFTSFYSFDGGIMTAFFYGDVEEKLFSAEILGDYELNESHLSGIVKSLGCTSGVFRLNSGDVPFTMGFPLCKDVPTKVEFTLALD